MKTYQVMAILLLFALQADRVRAETQFPEACRGGSGAMGAVGSMKMDPMAMPAKSDKPESYQAAAMAGMAAMSRDMATGTANKDPDVSFICGMMAHHLGAVQMSVLEQKFGSDPAAKELAAKIIKIQNDELAEMARWVEAHKPE